MLYHIATFHKYRPLNARNNKLFHVERNIQEQKHILKEQIEQNVHYLSFK
jgi:hypothetical protein